MTPKATPNNARTASDSRAKRLANPNNARAGRMASMQATTMANLASSRRVVARTEWLEPIPLRRYCAMRSQFLCALAFFELLV